MVAPTASAGHVERVYDDGYFFGGGAGYPDYLSEGTLLRAAGRRYARLLARHIPPGQILDIGAAAGFHLKGFEDCGWRGTGIEPNATMARYANEETGVRVLCGPVERIERDVRFDVFDAVSLIQVIGHFPDPMRVMRIAASGVRPGGLVLVEAWNRRSLTAPVLGPRWHEYSPPSVLHWFSIEGLVQVGRRAGLEDLDRGRPLKLLSAGHAAALLRHKLAGGRLGSVAATALGLIPARLPLLYPFDDVFWLLFRKLATPRTDHRTTPGARG
jgi:SAM-dependent methyltransferase